LINSKVDDSRKGLPSDAGFTPAIVTALLFKATAVNMPFWDDWERVPYIQMWHEGTLSLKVLYALHIDHRMFFPRLIMLVCNELSGGDLRLEIGVTFWARLAGRIVPHRAGRAGAPLAVP